MRSHWLSTSTATPLLVLCLLWLDLLSLEIFQHCVVVVLNFSPFCFATLSWRWPSLERWYTTLLSPPHVAGISFVPFLLHSSRACITLTKALLLVLRSSWRSALLNRTLYYNEGDKLPINRSIWTTFMPTHATSSGSGRRLHLRFPSVLF